MKLYLVQHGKALSKELDPARGLSKEGLFETEAVAQFLSSKQLKIDQIWHSDKTRSKQTADIFARGLSVSKLMERDDISPNDTVEFLPQEIHEEGKSVLIAGHNPFLAKLFSLLITGSAHSDIGGITNSGVVALRYDETWEIDWIITPGLIATCVSA